MADDESKGGGSGILFIVIVILFVIAVWFLTGGGKRASVSRSFFLAPPYATTSSFGVPSVNVGPSGYATPDTTYTESESSGAFSFTPSTKNSNGLSDTQMRSLGLSYLPVSPYAGKVKIESGALSYVEKATEEYIILRSNTDQRISISGWKLQSAITKRQATLPLAAEVYFPSSGITEGAIVLQPQDSVIVTSGRSPVGLSFKTNKCTGYLSQFQEFYPDLEERCPLPSEEAREHTYRGRVIIENACLDYLQSMPSCRTTISPPSYLPESCLSLINETLTYSGCFAAHRYDADFKSNEWRVYLGSSEKLWLTDREVLTLLDAQGKLVDSIVF